MAGQSLPHLLRARVEQQQPVALRANDYMLRVQPLLQVQHIIFLRLAWHGQGLIWPPERQTQSDSKRQWAP